MNKKIAVFSIILIAAASVFVAGGCQHRGFFHSTLEEKAQKITDHAADELDFTDSQEAALNSIKDEVVVKLKAMKQEREAVHSRIIDLVRSDVVTADAVNQLIEERHRAMEELRPFMVDKILQVHAMLTPEQREKLADKMQEFHNKRSRW